MTAPAPQPWAAVRRATLLVASGPAKDPTRKHLHIVLNDPVAADGRRASVALVSVCSLTQAPRIDRTCTLAPGSHPFIRHDSYVLYQRASVEDADHLALRVRQGLLTPHAPMEEPAFAAVVAGLMRSPFTQPYVRAFFEAATR